MKKWLIPMIYLTLLELQAVGVNGDHALVPGLGLLVLCLYHAFRDGAAVPKPALSRNEKVVAVLLALALGAVISMPLPIGFQYGIVLSLTSIFIMAVFTARRAFGGKIAARYGINKASITDNGIHTASVLMVYIISFHLGTQIWFSLAFQPVIIVSCLIVYSLINGQKILNKAKDGSSYITVDNTDKKMHDLAKYWNAFIGVWCVMLTKDNGFFTEGQEHLILFTYLISIFLIYFGAKHHFKAKELLWVAFFAGFLASLDPLTDEVLRLPIPSFIQTFLMIVALDLGGYFFHRQYDEPASAAALPLHHGRRALAYLLAAIFIFGVNLMAHNPEFDLENLQKYSGGAVYSSLLGAGDAGGANAAATGAQSAETGKITVDDPENAYHKAGN